MPSQKHVPLVFCVLFFAFQGCEAKPFATEILDFGMRFALFLVYVGGVKAVPHAHSTLDGPSNSTNPNGSSSMSSFESTATPSFSSRIPNSMTNSTFSHFAASTDGTPVRTKVAHVISEVLENILHAIILTEEATPVTTSREQSTAPTDLSSDSESDPSIQFENLILELSDATKMSPDQIHRLASLPKASKPVHSSHRSKPASSSRVGKVSSMAPTQSASPSVTKSRRSSKYGHMDSSTEKAGISDERIDHTEKRPLPSFQPNATFLPRPIFKHLDHGHISLTTEHRSGEHGTSHKRRAIGVPFYKIWREHLQDFASQGTQQRSRSREGEDASVQRRSWYKEQQAASSDPLEGDRANMASMSPAWNQSDFSKVVDASTTFFGPKANSSEPGISSIFRSFHEIDLDIDNEPNVTTVEYFRFTLKNLAKSKVFEWYSAYSILRAAEFGKYNEWTVFYSDFFDMPNFHCDLSYTECDFYDQDRILHHYSGMENRTIARRLIFISIMQKEFHQLLYALMNVSRLGINLLAC
jgi:hypothetical protein